jgi:DNA-binding NarL/FixJ family response regulator
VELTAIGDRPLDPRGEALVAAAREALRNAAAIERVAAGDAYFSPRLAAFVLQEFSTPEPASAQDPSLEAQAAAQLSP